MLEIYYCYYYYFYSENKNEIYIPGGFKANMMSEFLTDIFLVYNTGM